jgi:carbamoylphosphate synthase large subunit
MDKELSRLIFIENNIKVPKYLLLQKKNKLNLNKKISFPIVINQLMKDRVWECLFVKTGGNLLANIKN